MKTFPQMVYEEIRYKYSVPENFRITSPKDLLQFKEVADISAADHEEFWVMTLDTGANVIGKYMITSGLVNHSLVHPREVFRKAILDNAASIICFHNHPSGNLEPSQQDITVTKQLKAAGDIVGINLIDHIIVARDDITSMRESGHV